ncbi:MAG: general stress protein [Wolinella succinogenes]|uniref:NAD(P)H-dependent oxidoreductase n=1 Tax=Wolinella succinogenes TaxID=844 RepID=UPI0016986887|nr:NAD(P)H-dependent oxidoreductase [Wolinella succinogenes]NLU35033.1 general stress protein [Wolinella succinogenes]
MKKTLILLCHPNIAESRLNKALIQAIHGESHVTLHDLYATYKEAKNIDVAKEQALLLAHERIVLQFPLYWFSTPGLLKDWQDRVLEYGFAYGSSGDKLQGKEFKIAVTIGSPEYAYQSGAYVQSSLSEILKPIETMAIFTRMLFTPTFAIHRALKISDEELAQKALEYRELLRQEDWTTSHAKYIAS